MNNLRIAAFLDALRRSELVRSADMRAIEEWFLHPEVDVQVSAKRIVSQGWLTSMQVRMFWHGRGDELYLHQYILIDKIGEGGMGEVYRAWHRAMDRVVALKLIRPERLDNPEAIRRFRREIRAAASLSHENIVMAFDADESDGRNFFVMEYVDGRNLWDVVRESGRLSVRRASDLIRQAALGLQHAHERGMVHRDIKPSNLLVNGIRALKILDMGLARLTATADANEAVNPLTKDGAVVGTPDFIAPEQARNAATADIRADIYSLGATLYYLLTASPPFPEGSVTEKLLRHTVDPVPDPSILRSDIPPALRAIVMKMMAKSPGDRYEIPMQVAEKLIPFCVDPAAAASGVLRRLSPRPLVEELGADFSNPFGVGPAIPAVAVASALPVRHSLSFDTNLPPTVEEWVKPPNAIGRFVALAAGGAVLLLLLGLCLYLFAFDGRKKVDASMPPTLKFRSDIRMVLIPAGRFSMGSPETEARRYESEGPLHEVEIGYPFYMGRTEVTQGQYAAIFGQTPFEFRNQKDSKDLAAENVSWRDAVAFCDKLNSETETTRPKGMVWRLPSEAEWEYACRAGTKSRYSCGDVLSPEPFVYAESGARSPAKARTTSENAFKLSEMHGNVWEWCADCYAADWYANSPTKNPTGPKNGKQRVLRGGAWNTSDTECRSAHRRGEAMDFADGSIGFRLVLGPELADK